MQGTVLQLSMSRVSLCVIVKGLTTPWNWTTEKLPRLHSNEPLALYNSRLSSGVLQHLYPLLSSHHCSSNKVLNTIVISSCNMLHAMVRINSMKGRLKSITFFFFN